MTQQGQIGIYVHWPFCMAKCPYCDFNSHVRESIDETSWLNGYLKALDHYQTQMPDAVVRSIFFGGGTPSLMAPSTVEAIIGRVQKNWRITNDVEITLEANPTSVEAEKFVGFRSAGVNRVSMGVQSLIDADLKFLGRQHSAAEALVAIDIARKTFDRYSFDLIYARPDQSLKDWEVELSDALQHTNGHMSLYQLTIERRTPFYMAHARGDFTMPDDNIAADFYLLTQDIMRDAGLPAYEISNHAVPGQESRHNLTYWDYDDYIGVGPGAHGRLSFNAQKYATREHSTPDIWLERAGKDGRAAHDYDALSPDEQIMEALMMGLRLTDGISRQRILEKTGCDVDVVLSTDKRATLINEGWMEDHGDVLKLTLEGRMRLNAILTFLFKDNAVPEAA